MAKQADDREDLMRDATGYIRRVEFRLPEYEQPVFCGFRECGALSVYFGQDNVFQFNLDGELRRAHWQNRMVASYRNTPNWLEKFEGRVKLARTPFSDEEHTTLVSAVGRYLGLISKAVIDGPLEISATHPSDEDVIAAVRNWLNEWGTTCRFAMHPGLARARKRDA